MDDPKHPHPYRRFGAQAKLREARASARKRYLREYRPIARESERMRSGIPVDLPKLKPWDWEKRKVEA